MFDTNARNVLAKPLIARLTTLDPDGYPHTVPLWFALDGDEDAIMMISVRGTRKVRNLLANPKGAVAVGGEAGNGGGYLIQGDLSVEDDVDGMWTRRMVYRYESGDQAEQDIADWLPLDMVVIRLQPRRVIKVAG